MSEHQRASRRRGWRRRHGLGGVMGGLNYFLDRDHAKLQLAYGRPRYANRTPLDEVVLAAQASF